MHTSSIRTTNVILNHTSSIDDNMIKKNTPRDGFIATDVVCMRDIDRCDWNETKKSEEIPDAPVNITSRWQCDDKTKICNSTLDWSQAFTVGKC